MHTQKHAKIARKKRWLILDRNLIEFNFLKSFTSAFDRLLLWSTWSFQQSYCQQTISYEVMKATSIDLLFEHGMD